MEVMTEMNAAEALYGFVGWITTREKEVTAGSKHNCVVWAELVDEFIKHNELQSVRDDVWPSNMKTHPN